MKVKILHNGYILGLAIADAGVEVSDEEFNELTEIFHNMPVKEGYAYKLREDLTWEEVEREPEPIDEILPEEALEILMGGNGE